MKNRQLINSVAISAFAVTLSVVYAAGVKGYSRVDSIDISPQASATQPSPTLPFDLVATGFDLNGIMSAPKWGGQVDDNTFPDPSDTVMCPQADFFGERCSSTHQNVDKPHFPHSFICGVKGVPKGRANGHVNWTVATYEGTIFFNNYSDDFDYTWTFKPEGGAGLTKKNPGSLPDHPEFIHAEFDATESINSFITPTWSALREGFECFEDDPNCPELMRNAREKVDGKRAVITGLIGLDTEHGGYSELHPMYALAIEINPDPMDDTWILFIRNRGNEGFCSSHDHPLVGMDRFTLVLPKPQESQVTGAEITRSNFASTVEDNCPTVGFDATNKQGEILMYNLPQNAQVGSPVRGPMLEGEVHIRWQSDTPITPFQREHVPAATFLDEDEHFLTREQRKVYRRRITMEGLQSLTSSTIFHSCTPRLNAEFPTPESNAFISPEGISRARMKLRVGSIGQARVEREIRRKHQAIFRDLCLASNNKLPGCVLRRKAARPTRRRP